MKRHFILFCFVILAILFYHVAKEEPSVEPEPYFGPVTIKERTAIQAKYGTLPPVDRVKAQAVLTEAESLWMELERLKYDPDYRRLRFVPGNRYSDWQSRAQALYDSRPPRSIIGGDAYDLPSGLLALSHDYAGGNNLQPYSLTTFRDYYVANAKKSLQ